MEDLVNTVLLCSIWCDGGGRDFGSEFKSLLSPSYLTWGRSLLSLLPISKMKVVRVEWKPLAQSLPPNRCSVNTGLGSPASTCSDITTHLDICPRHCPFCVCPALVTGRWGVAGEEAWECGKEKTAHTGGGEQYRKRGVAILTAPKLGWMEIKGRSKAQQLHQQLRLGQDCNSSPSTSCGEVRQG